MTRSRRDSPSWGRCRPRRSRRSSFSSRSSTAPSGPMAVRLSGIGRKFTSAKKIGRTEKRLAQAGNPGDLRTVDFLGMKVVVAGAVAGVVILLLGVVMGNLSFGIIAAHGGWRDRLLRPRVLAHPAHQEAPQADPARGAGHPRPAHDLRASRPRLRRRAGQGRGEDQGPARGRVPPGARRDPHGQDAPRGAARPGRPVRTSRPSPTSSPPSSRPSSWACPSARCSRSSRSSCASSAASARRRRPPRPPSRCCSRSSGCIFPSMFIVILGPAIILIAVNMAATSGT